MPSEERTTMSETDMERPCSPVDIALPREVVVTQELSKKVFPPLKLDVEQEETSFDFVEAHSELYDKGHTEFMKTHRKDALWQHLADTLKATDFDGMCYAFGLLVYILNINSSFNLN